jgi:hypothetical protein
MMSILSRPHWCLASLFTLCACSLQGPAHRYAFADPAAIRAALYFWQEGPTDGRVCLDPYALSSDTIQVADGAEWSDTVLTAVLRDTLVALDSTRETSRQITARKCAPSADHPRISVGVPVRHGDGVELELGAWAPPTSAAPAHQNRNTVVLARVESQWRLVGVLGRHFQVLPGSR